MDQAEFLQQAVVDGRTQQRSITITGAGSKKWMLPVAQGELLSTGEHTGIISYEPGELVVTARAGTPLRELAQELAQNNQMLACDPPLFAGAGTVGGAVSAGLSGGGRPWYGSVRDAVLGIEMINGLGEQLAFGGQVMKNVAGYDVSRLLTGAFGSLGLVLTVSVRVAPRSAHKKTVALQFSADEAIETCRSLARKALPLSAAAWVDGRLYLRLSGAESALRAASAKLGGETISEGSLWENLRDHAHGYFKAADIEHNKPTGSKLWRLVVPAAAPLPEVPTSDLLIEWAGGLRWLWHADAAFVESYAAGVGGWAWAMGESQNISAGEKRVMNALKQAFDPDGVFQSPLGLEPVSAH